MASNSKQPRKPGFWADLRLATHTDNLRARLGGACGRQIIRAINTWRVAYGYEPIPIKGSWLGGPEAEATKRKPKPKHRNRRGFIRSFLGLLGMRTVHVASTGNIARPRAGNPQSEAPVQPTEAPRADSPQPEAPTPRETKMSAIDLFGDQPENDAQYLEGLKAMAAELSGHSSRLEEFVATITGSLGLSSQCTSGQSRAHELLAEAAQALLDDAISYGTVYGPVSELVASGVTIPGNTFITGETA